MPKKKHKADAAKARMRRLSADNAALREDVGELRAALASERAFWKHSLFCPECAAVLHSKHLCADGWILRLDYLRRAHGAAPKKKAAKTATAAGKGGKH